MSIYYFLCYKLSLAILLSTLFLPVLLGQESDTVRVYGEVDTKDGQTLKGEITYDLQNNNLQIIVDSIVKSYDMSAIESFQVFDQETRQKKIFFSLPYQLSPDFYRDFAFELLLEGKISLFSRVLPTEEYRNVYYHGNYVWVKTTILKENYFIFDRNSELIACKSTLKALLKFTKNKEKEMEIFFKKNQLKLEKRKDMIKIIDYYNKLFVK